VVYAKVTLLIEKQHQKIVKTSFFEFLKLEKTINSLKKMAF
jgi:hypothetical protein